MEVEISSRVFEWLLADWAGYGDDPGEVFPALRDTKQAVLADELEKAIQKAKLCQRAV